MDIFLYAEGWGDALPDRALLRDVAARSGGGGGSGSGEAPLRASLFMVPGRALELTGADGRDPAPDARSEDGRQEGFLRF